MSEHESPKPRLWAGQVGGVLVLLALILWFVQMRRAPSRLLERRDCERAYAAAQTRADSEAVDSRRPITRAPTDTGTCGGLRASGELQ